jgi:uncharacterized protein (DUF2336 family)
VREVSREVRSKLANRLASAPAVPRELAVMLANDEIDIASPILLGSPALRDVDLIEIIHNRSRQHLLAVAMRRDLSMPVSAALVETGHSDVILTLLSNQDARISEATLAYVVEQSRVNDEFQEPLIRRKDLPRSLGVRMSYWVSAAIRKAIIERFEIDAGEIDDLIEPTIKDEAAGIAQMQPAAPHPSAAEQLARSLKSSGRLSSSLMLQTLRRGEVALFEAMLAAANELRLSLVQRFLYEEGGSGLAVLAKAMRLSREEFSTIFLLTRRARSVTAAPTHRAGPGGHLFRWRGIRTGAKSDLLASRPGISGRVGPSAKAPCEGRAANDAGKEHRFRLAAGKGRSPTPSSFATFSRRNWWMPGRPCSWPIATARSNGAMPVSAASPNCRPRRARSENCSPSARRRKTAPSGATPSIARSASRSGPRRAS